MYIMCPPIYYDIKYSINPWMDPQNKPTPEYWNQWLDVYSALLNTREKISLINPNDNLPDQVFAANYGSFIKDKFLLSTYKNLERMPERIEMAQWCNKNNITIMSMPNEMCFEGDGDLIKIDSNTYAMGYGFRTDYESCKFLQDITGKEIIPLKLNNPYFYHLDTCFFVIETKEGKKIVLYPGAFGAEDLEKLQIRYQTILVPEDEAMNFVCNSVVHNKNILMSNKNVKTGYILQQYGYSVRYINVSEFCKAGGGVRCLILRTNSL